MMILRRLLGCGNTDERIRELTNDNIKLKQKLEERQEVINKTNAYWKKRLAAQNSKNKNGSSKS